jgi:hypothetical protein
VSTLEPQLGLYETTLDNPDLEAQLEEREKRRTSLSALRKRYAQADATAKELIERLELGDDVTVCVGRFLITRRRIPARSVAFDVDSSTRLSIRPMKDA